VKLLNDASAAMIYRLAVGGAAAGSFSVAAVAPFLGRGGRQRRRRLGARWLIVRVITHVQHVPRHHSSFVGTCSVWLLAESIGLSACDDGVLRHYGGASGPERIPQECASVVCRVGHVVFTAEHPGVISSAFSFDHLGEPGSRRTWGDTSRSLAQSSDRDRGALRLACPSNAVVGAGSPARLSSSPADAAAERRQRGWYSCRHAGYRHLRRPWLPPEFPYRDLILLTRVRGRGRTLSSSRMTAQLIRDRHGDADATTANAVSSIRSRYGNSGGRAWPPRRVTIPRMPDTR